MINEIIAGLGIAVIGIIGALLWYRRQERIVMELTEKMLYHMEHWEEEAEADWEYEQLIDAYDKEHGKP